MSDDKWVAVDTYIEDRLVAKDPVLDTVLERNAAAGLPAIDVSATQGQFLNLLVRMAGARSVLEIGTLGGYSTIWLARGLPGDGRLITLELEPHHARTARGNLELAGLGDRVDIRVGPAIDSLRAMIAAGEGPFDFIFIDADKSSYPMYAQACLELARKGTVMVGDNVVRGGGVVEPKNPDPNVQGVRRYFDLLAGNADITSTALQTVGAKGWDGFAISLIG